MITDEFCKAVNGFLLNTMFHSVKDMTDPCNKDMANARLLKVIVVTMKYCEPPEDDGELTKFMQENMFLFNVHKCLTFLRDQLYNEIMSANVIEEHLVQMMNEVKYFDDEFIRSSLMLPHDEFIKMFKDDLTNAMGIAVNEQPPHTTL